MDSAAFEQGWITVPDLLTLDECASILAACDAIIADPTDRHHRDKPASGTKHLEDLTSRIELVADVVSRPALTDSVAAWLDREEAPAPQKVGLRSPGPGFGGQDLHRDAPEGDPKPVPDAVTAIIALVPFTETNGATRIVPGSHRTSQPASSYRGRQSAPGEVRLTGAAGTAFVFNGHALHSGMENRSDQERPALQVAWNTASLPYGIEGQ